MSSSDFPTPDSVFDTLWRDRVTTPSGEFDPDLVKLELFNYAATLNNMAFLFKWLTDGHVTSPLTDIHSVMDLADRLAAANIDQSIHQVLAEVMNEIVWAEEQDTFSAQDQLEHVTNFIDALIVRLTTDG